MTRATAAPRAWLQEFAPWMLAEEFGVCVVGSTALATACARAGIEGPKTNDLDLSWALDVDAGTELLQKHGVYQKITDQSRSRGTLACKIDDTRIEITSFRGPREGTGGDAGGTGGDAEGTMEERIRDDLAGRDMTLGALAHWLAEDRIVDPFDGLGAFCDGRIVPVGDPATRIAEHPIRWMRYYRRAYQWGFGLDPKIRAVDVDPQILMQEPSEAVGGELRAALLQCPSPGRFLNDLFKIGVLQVIAPELALQFDGRPAGPVQHHPEGSQGNHLTLALEWIVARTQDLPTRDRLAAAVAVLCHDLGKGLTDPKHFPSHHGHEDSGVAPLHGLLERYPGLTDPAGKRLAEAVCTLHLKIRRVDQMRPGTLAKLYAQHFKDKFFRTDLFALAVGADSGGRTGKAAEGEAITEQVRTDIEWIQARCATVDAGGLYQQFGKDKERFRSELHQAWARVLRR